MSADLCHKQQQQVKMLQRWERESRRSRRKQELRRSGLPPSPSSLLFSSLASLTSHPPSNSPQPTFLFATGRNDLCKAQVENAQLYLAALESTLQPQPRWRRWRNQENQPYLHQVYFPTKAEKSKDATCYAVYARLRENSIKVLAFLMGHAM